MYHALVSKCNNEIIAIQLCCNLSISAKVLWLVDLVVISNLISDVEQTLNTIFTPLLQFDRDHRNMFSLVFPIFGVINNHNTDFTHLE
jgi:hypothetical protein